MVEIEGVPLRGHVAIVDCGVYARGFAGLAATLDKLRDTDARVVVLDTTTLDRATWRDVREAPAVGAAVLPTVAAWCGAPNGTALAVGLYADIRVGDRSLTLDVGQIDGRDSLERLALLLGDSPPPGAVLTCDEAFELGLISELYPTDGGALAAAVRIAEAIAERGPIATQLAKEAIWRGLAMPLEQALRFETDLTLLLQATKDRDEGVRAFLEKRPPKFGGV